MGTSSCGKKRWFQMGETPNAKENQSISYVDVFNSHKITKRLDLSSTYKLHWSPMKLSVFHIWNPNFFFSFVLHYSLFFISPKICLFWFVPSTKPRRWLPSLIGVVDVSHRFSLLGLPVVGRCWLLRLARRHLDTSSLFVLGVKLLQHTNINGGLVTILSLLFLILFFVRFCVLKFFEKVNFCTN